MTESFASFQHKVTKIPSMQIAYILSKHSDFNTLITFKFNNLSHTPFIPIILPFHFKSNMATKIWHFHIHPTNLLKFFFFNCSILPHFITTNTHSQIIPSTEGKGNTSYWTITFPFCKKQFISHIFTRNGFKRLTESDWKSLKMLNAHLLYSWTNLCCRILKNLSLFLFSCYCFDFVFLAVMENNIRFVRKN